MRHCCQSGTEMCAVVHVAKISVPDSCGSHSYARVSVPSRRAVFQFRLCCGREGKLCSQTVERAFTQGPTVEESRANSGPVSEADRLVVLILERGRGRQEP